MLLAMQALRDKRRDGNQRPQKEENDTFWRKSASLTRRTGTLIIKTVRQKGAPRSRHNSRIMKILSIGNSFSQDAQAYLHDAAASAGLSLDCVNLFIGGCSLERHYNNLISGEKAYVPEYNGQPESEPVSLPEMLAGERYDIVTLQQASHFSGKYETYDPYITELYGAVRKNQPHAKIYIHETWAYETDCQYPLFANYGYSQAEMYRSLREAYSKISRKLGLELIPAGSCIQYFRENLPQFDYAHGGKPLTRDGFHMSIPIGRLIVALVWLEKLFGADASRSAFVPAEAADEDIALLPEVRATVHKFMSSL